MPEYYYFNDHVRWTLFWENPNCWAAFLTCLIAWAWFAQAGLRLKSKFKLGLVALYIVEAGTWFLLVKTYSRGGLVAAVVGMVMFFGLRGTGCQPVSSMGILPMRFMWHGRLARVFSNIFARIALIAVLCAAVGFASRISPDYIAQDKSVLNRMDMWKGALVMIHDSPFSGWGYNLSGLAYRNWYQPLSHETRPIGFVNSYLEIAVEFGSHFLFLTIICASALLLIAVKLRKKSWVIAAGASLAAWLVCNFWSSLWLWPSLWILPGIAVVCIIAGAILSKLDSHKEPHQAQRKDNVLWPKWFGNFYASCDFLRLIIVSLVVGVVVWIANIGAGHVFAKDFPFQAKPVARGDAAIVSRRGGAVKSSALNTEFWADAAITGRYWGRAIRTILDNDNNTCGTIIVYAPWAIQTNRREQPANKYAYSGFQAELVPIKISGKESFIILHPTVYPPAPNLVNEHHAEIVVCLPAIDLSANNLAWRLWAAANGAKLIFSPQDGIRINPEQDGGFWKTLLFQ